MKRTIECLLDAGSRDPSLRGALTHLKVLQVLMVRRVREVLRQQNHENPVNLENHANLENSRCTLGKYES